MVTARTPAVFIHGLWLHAQSWKNWIELFRATGYEPIAPSWPGIPATVEQARAHPEGIGGHGIIDVTDHYAGIIHSLASKPIVFAIPSAVSSARSCWGGAPPPPRFPLNPRRVR